MEIKCQLDATDGFYCRPYCLLNMFRAPLCPSSGAREYYTSGCCLSYLVLWFSSCRYGVELRVMCPVCGLLVYALLSFPNGVSTERDAHFQSLFYIYAMVPSNEALFPPSRLNFNRSINLCVL